MSQNSLVRFALNNAYLKEQGVPELREIWIRLHYGGLPKTRVFKKFEFFIGKIFR